MEFVDRPPTPVRRKVKAMFDDIADQIQANPTEWLAVPIETAAPGAHRFRAQTRIITEMALRSVRVTTRTSDTTVYVQSAGGAK